MAKPLTEEIGEVFIAVSPSALTFIALFIIIKIIPDEGIFTYILKFVLGITAICSLLITIIVIICAPISLIRRRQREQNVGTSRPH